jgi:nitrite reductase/ring-hydroxylating ferredoxin subunit
MSDSLAPLSRECDDCPIADAVERRAFIREALSGVAVAFAALGVGPARASAMSVMFAHGTGPRAEKRYPIPPADGVVIDKKESVIIARSEGKLFAFSLACPHQNTALRWDKSNNRFKCPKHESRYRPDGVFIDGRATRGMDRFAIKREAEEIVVNLDALYREDENKAEWANAVVLLSEK